MNLFVKRICQIEGVFLKNVDKVSRIFRWLFLKSKMGKKSRQIEGVFEENRINVNKDWRIFFMILEWKLKMRHFWVIFKHCDETTVGGENRHPRSSSIGAAIYFAAPFKTLIFWPPFISCYEAKTCTTLRSLELVVEVALKVFKLISQKGDLLRSSPHCCEFLTVVMTAFWRS